MDVKRSTPRHILMQFENNRKKEMILEGLGHTKRMRNNIINLSKSHTNMKVRRQ